MAGADEYDACLRLAMFAHLDRLCAAHPDGIRSDLINSFIFEGRPWKLVVQQGIWKPKELVAALTIRTTYTPPGAEAPYEDTVARDGSLRYKLRGTDRSQSDNRALREAMQRQAPLAYFYPVARSVYQPIYPVYLVEEDPQRHEFTVDLDQHAHREPGADQLDRRYRQRLTLHRLHQAIFAPAGAARLRVTVCVVPACPSATAGLRAYPAGSSSAW